MTKTARSGMRVITLNLGMLLPQILSSSRAEALMLRVPTRAAPLHIRVVSGRGDDQPKKQ